MPLAETGALAIRDVSKRFRTRTNTVHALDSVSLTVRPGEFICLVGPSGCGKSTLLDIVAGLTKPDAGTVTADGEPIAGPGRHRATRCAQGLGLLAAARGFEGLTHLDGAGEAILGILGQGVAVDFELSDLGGEGGGVFLGEVGEVFEGEHEVNECREKKGEGREWGWTGGG